MPPLPSSSPRGHRGDLPGYLCGGTPTHLHLSGPTDGELYSGTSSDFMGSSAAFFRTWVHGAEQSYIRTEQNQDHWLHGRNRGIVGLWGARLALLPGGERLGPALGSRAQRSGPFTSWGEALMKPLMGPMFQHSLCSLSIQEWGSAFWWQGLHGTPCVPSAPHAAPKGF